MSTYTITIDGGTTNTRCILWDDRRLRIDEARREVGVRNTAIDGSSQKLKQAVKECLEQLLDGSSLTYRDIRHIIASGMITSDVGIVEVPHLTAPAGLDEIAAATKELLLPDVCPIPIHFIPGIKNTEGNITFDDYESMDIMRGEEVESLAIIHKYHKGQPMLLILPGSHNKFVSVDQGGRITGCLTSISGELLASVTNDTIIAKSVGRSFVTSCDYDRDWMLLGYENAKRVGLGRACFSGRILSLFREKNPSKIANYILGAVLQGDITAIMNSQALSLTKDTHVVISGKAPLNLALRDILHAEHIYEHATIYEPDRGFSTSALGAYLVAEKMQLL